MFLNSLMRYSLLFLMFFLQISFLGATKTLSTEEANLLRPLMFELMEDAELGYLLYDKKPVCLASYEELPNLFEEVSFFEKASTVIFCALPILDSPHLKSDKILFHHDRHSGSLLIINRNLFLDTVQKNLPLFQYVLGPTTTPQLLLEALISHDASFFGVLRDDKVLTGILLGFGLENALCYNRFVRLQSNRFNVPDLPPYSSSETSGDEKLLRTHFDPRDFEVAKSSYKRPSLGFKTTGEEKQFFVSKEVISSPQLREVAPRYVFADYGFDTSFLRDLEDCQKKIQNFLTQRDWFEKTLEMIYGEPVVVSSSQLTPLPLSNVDSNLLFAKLLKQRFLRWGDDPSFASYCAEGLRNSHDTHYPKFTMHISPDYKEEIEIARKNLAETNAFFASLDQNPSYSPILKNYLYYKITKEGSGDSLNQETDLRLDFAISDSQGKKLNHGENVQLQRGEMIPGFAHGLTKMKPGETRTIYIHPAVAYGVNTTLEKGSYLEATVKLRTMANKGDSLPALEPLELSFIHDELYLKKCEEEYKKLLDFQGRMRGASLRTIPNLDVNKIAKYFDSLDDQVELSPEEINHIHAVLWNFFFASNTNGG